MAIGADREPVDVSLDRLFEIVDLARACGTGQAPVAGKPAAAAEQHAGALRRAIDALPEDQRAVLFALALIGRGEFSSRDFDIALTKAFDRDPRALATGLMQMPGLGDALERGAIACGAEFSPASRGASNPQNRRLH